MSPYAVVVAWSEEDGVFVAEAPDLRPCAAHGKTAEAAMAELEIAIKAWIDVAREEEMPIPEARFAPGALPGGLPG